MESRNRKRSNCASGSGNVPSSSIGFCVASTRNGRGSGRVSPSTLTWRSSMHSRSADCVRGVARLISSASTTWAKIGPGRNSNSCNRWLKNDTPVTSLGSRSGVNWMRRNGQSSVRATDLASMVLPMPGTSSMSTCPSHNSATSSRSMTSRLPTMTCSILFAARSAIVRIGSTSSIDTVLFGVGEAVAHATFGEDIAWVGGVVLELLAQVVDVQADVVRGVAVLGAPDATEQCLVGNDHARVRGEVVQQPELGRPQLDLLAVFPDFVSVKVDCQAIVDAQDARGGRLWRRLSTPQHRFDARQQDSRRKRLGNVVVGAELQAVNDVAFVGFDRQQ